MSITLDPAALEAVFGKSLLTMLDQPTRDKLVQEAINYLVTAPRPSSYNSKTSSPIQSAFENAICLIANRVATEMLESDASLQEKIRGLFTEAMERAFITNREAVVSRMAHVFSQGLIKEDR